MAALRPTSHRLKKEILSQKKKNRDYAVEKRKGGGGESAPNAHGEKPAYNKEFL